MGMISGNPRIQAEYETMLSRGVKPRLAEMLALRAAPKLLTESVFSAGVGTLDKQFAGDEQQLDHLTKQAMKHGYKPNINDVYTPALARFRGDPLAFVPAQEGLGHIRKVCEQRGLACEGAVNVKGRQQDKAITVTPLAEDLIREKTQQAIAADPGLKFKSKRELREQIIDRHGSKSKEI